MVPAYRKKEVTRERKQMAEEKARLEIMAQKVSGLVQVLFTALIVRANNAGHFVGMRRSLLCVLFRSFRSHRPITSQMSAKKLARKKRRLGITKKVSHA